MVDELLLTVDIELEVTGALYVDHIFACLLWGEGGLVFSREILDGQVGCKDMHTCSSHIHWLRVIFCGEGLAIHLSIVPERTFQTLLAVGSHTFSSQVTLHHLVVG